MDLSELFLILLVGAIVLAGPLVTFILAIIAFTRSSQVKGLATRVAQLERQLSGLQSSGSLGSSTQSLVEGVPGASGAEKSGTPALVAQLVDNDDESSAVVGFDSVPEQSQDKSLPAQPAASAASPSGNAVNEPVGWETFVGQKAFGWLAVVLFIFSAAFFLRYAFQNNWIGPVGRVTIGELVGVSLAVAGWFYHRRGLQRFSSMVTAAGIVVLYLSTWSAFGFYQLLPQTHAGLFLAILVFESMVAAVVYRSVAIAIAAVLGGLLTPILLASPHDTYWSLFSYLTILNLGVVAASWYRRWPAVASISYAGTQWLFWGWYSLQYHPEKFAWAIGFQVVIFLLFWMHGVLKLRGPRVALNQATSDHAMDREELVRYIANALVGFAGIYVLLRADYRVWLGAAALTMATLYAWSARLSLMSKAKDQRLLLISLALSLGFIAWALPLQASTGWYAMSRWVAMGWAIIGLSLWKFGLRIHSPALRVMAGSLGTLAVGRVLVHDLAFYTREPFIPVFNSVALPSLIVAAALLYSVISADRFLQRLRGVEPTLIGIGGIAGVVLLWLVLSFECYGYFVSRSLFDDQIDVWRWRGQLALTVFWTAFATTLLVLGFRLDRARLRWLAIALYAITVCKLFTVDMANVHQIYRILGFFVLAVVLGLVARAYQRFR